MKFLIKKLYHLSDADVRYFGNKAYHLGMASKNKFNVLPGFCVAVKTEFVSIVLKDDCFISELKNEYEELRNTNISESFIVRSSGQNEDTAGHLFPGLYKSMENVKGFDALLHAISECFESVNTKRIEQYASLLKIEKQRGWFCVIVQPWIAPEVSGVAFSKSPLGAQSDGKIYVELDAGICNKLLAGNKHGNSYVIFVNNNQLLYQCLSKTISNINEEMLMDCFDSLYESMAELIKIFTGPLDVEWAYFESSVYILQIRQVDKPEKNRGEDHFIFDDDVSMGAKAQAMKLFVKYGLFNRRVLFAAPGETIENIISTINSSYFDDEEITIRYSHENDIGLPRAFLKCRQEAIQYIKDTRGENWTVIAYNSFYIKSSYEVYVDEEKMIIEHVPGIWESDSGLQADTLIVSGKKCGVYCVKIPRKARFETSEGNYYAQVPPASAEDLMGIIPMIEEFLFKMKLDFKNIYPMNFHFVEDFNGEYFFINIRKTKKIYKNATTSSKVHIIESFEDFNAWDQKTNLLLRPQISRGEEQTLIEFVNKLKSVQVSIFVDFGILSHPAIMLREFGINIQPLYLNHKYHEYHIERK